MASIPEPLATELNELAAVFGDGMTAMHLGGSFTCPEANTIAAVLALSGHIDAASEWLAAHAEHDEDHDLHVGWSTDIATEATRAIARAYVRRELLGLT